MQIVTKSLRPDSGLQVESQGRLQGLVRVAPRVLNTSALPDALSFRDTLRVDPQAALGVSGYQGNLGEALPLHDGRICLREQIFQLKASSLSVKLEKDYPSSPSAILRSPGLPPDYRALGLFTEAARMEYPGGLISPFFLSLSPSLRAPPGARPKAERRCPSKSGSQALPSLPPLCLRHAGCIHPLSSWGLSSRGNIW